MDGEGFEVWSGESEEEIKEVGKVEGKVGVR